MRTLVALSLLTVGSGTIYQFGSHLQGEIWRVVVGMGLFGLIGLVLGSIADNFLLWLMRLAGGRS